MPSLEGKEGARKLWSVNNRASKTVLNSKLKREKNLHLEKVREIKISANLLAGNNILSEALPSCLLKCRLPATVNLLIKREHVYL